MYSEHCEMFILIIIITIIIISSSNYHYHHHYIHFYYYYHYYQCYREKTVGNNRDSVFIIIVPFMMNANSRIRFGLQIVFVCLYITPSHYHHFANLSEDIELMKCLSDIFFVECVSKIEHIISVIHYTIYGAVCFQFTHFPCDDWENINFVLLSSLNQKLWTIVNRLGLGHETMVCAVCLGYIVIACYALPIEIVLSYPVLLVVMKG